MIQRSAGPIPEELAEYMAKSDPEVDAAFVDLIRATIRAHEAELAYREARARRPEETAKGSPEWRRWRDETLVLAAKIDDHVAITDAAARAVARALTRFWRGNDGR